jgi:hypothetical protein
MTIPVTFTHNSKTYSGILSGVSGAATSSMWHLYVKGYYQGQLIKTAQGEWQFSTQKEGIIPELSAYFGRVVEAGKP